MKYKIRICQGVNCQNYLSEDLFKYAKELTAENPDINIEKRNCMNLCSKAPNMEVIDETGKSKIHHEMDHQKTKSLIEKQSLA